MEVERTRVSVLIDADDAILKAGIVSHLRPRPEVRLVDGAIADADVAVVVVDRLDEASIALLKHHHRCSAAGLVLVASELGPDDVVAAAEAGVVALLRRGDATDERLVETIASAARNEGTVPSDLLGRLLNQVGALQRSVLQPRGLSFNGLAAREVEVLRLVADGYDTTEIAQRMAYSERTVKNVLHDITSRLQLRNRSHAVAFALREGLI